MADKCFLIIGGGGMIGHQVACEICQKLKPDKVIIASLYQKEVQAGIRVLKRQFSGVTFVPFWGNVFVRASFTGKDRNRLFENSEWRDALYDDLFGGIENALGESQLAKLVLDHRPDVIVDSINTATAISYQDVDKISAKIRSVTLQLNAEVDDLSHFVKQAVERFENQENTTLVAKTEDEETRAMLTRLQTVLDLLRTREDMVRKPSLQELTDTLIISQSIPQLVRHVFLLYEAMKRARTRLYLKIGTTGTGGMGFNIPYTHSEAKPSAQLMSKTAVAFAQTGLLFLMSRTPDAPIVKEIKPAAMVGYQQIAMQTIKARDGSTRFVYEARQERLGDVLNLRLPDREFAKSDKLKMVGVDTGENGFFALGEFEAITGLKQMEFTTPEEIAETVVLEIQGRNTGMDIIAGLDASVMKPSYRAGFLRNLVVQRIRKLDGRVGNGHSVALRDLGPPELSKLLYEAHLIALEYSTLEAVSEHSPSEMAAAAEKRLQEDPSLRNQITSIGIPILFPDGKTFWRGPLVAYPEGLAKNSLKVTAEQFETWVNKGWVDLREDNMRSWHRRFVTILRKRREQLSKNNEGSAAFTQEFYSRDEIRIGEIVSWIFNNEMEGHRILGS